MANVQSCNRTLIPTTAALKTGSKHLFFKDYQSWLIVTRLLLVLFRSAVKYIFLHLNKLLCICGGKTVFVDVLHVPTLGHRLPMMLCRKLVVLRQCESIHRNLLRVILTGVMISQKIFTLFPTYGVSCVGSFSETLCFCTFLSVSS